MSTTWLLLFLKVCNIIPLQPRDIYVHTGSSYQATSENGTRRIPGWLTPCHGAQDDSFIPWFAYVFILVLFAFSYLCSCKPLSLSSALFITGSNILYVATWKQGKLRWYGWNWWRGSWSEQRQPRCGKMERQSWRSTESENVSHKPLSVSIWLRRHDCFPHFSLNTCHSQAGLVCQAQSNCARAGHVPIFASHLAKAGHSVAYPVPLWGAADTRACWYAEKTAGTWFRLCSTFMCFPQWKKLVMEWQCVWCMKHLHCRTTKWMVLIFCMSASWLLREMLCKQMQKMSSCAPWRCRSICLGKRILRYAALLLSADTQPASQDFSHEYRICKSHNFWMALCTYSWLNCCTGNRHHDGQRANVHVAWQPASSHSSAKKSMGF